MSESKCQKAKVTCNAKATQNANVKMQKFGSRGQKCKSLGSKSYVTLQNNTKCVDEVPMEDLKRMSEIMMPDEGYMDPQDKSIDFMRTVEITNIEMIVCRMNSVPLELAHGIFPYFKV